MSSRACRVQGWNESLMQRSGAVDVARGVCDYQEPPHGRACRSTSLIAFQRRVPHRDACAARLCQRSTNAGPRAVPERPLRSNHGSCGRGASGPASWLSRMFWAAYRSPPAGIAALQLQNQLGIGAAPGCSPPTCRASSRSTRPRWRSAPRMIPVRRRASTGPTPRPPSRPTISSSSLSDLSRESK